MCVNQFTLPRCAPCGCAEGEMANQKQNYNEINYFFLES